MNFSAFVPESLIPVLVILVLSFLIGLEREERAGGGRYYNFGGVRTFPIMGLSGYILSELSQKNPFLLAAGTLVLGALLWLSYRKKLELSSAAGMTSEVSGLFTFLLGALADQQDLWEVTALAVLVLLLLEFKQGLEALAKKIPPFEIFTFTRFLLISAVILPIVPNKEFSFFNFNPYHTWLIVVAISGLSYASYVASRFFGARKSLWLAAILGGLYSSTNTTVVLSKQSRDDSATSIYTGAIILASGFMYFRLVLLLSIFNGSLGQKLAGPFLVMGLLFVGVGALFMRHQEQRHETGDALKKRNPLELQSALIFAALFTLMGVLTLWTRKNFGAGGIYGLSFITGLTDVDPYVMSLTQSANQSVSLELAARGIVIATISNNFMKGIYAAIWAAPPVKKRAAVGLITLAVLSLACLFFV